MGETARLRLRLGSARASGSESEPPLPIFFDLRDWRIALKRQRTAISTTDFFRGFVPSCESLAYSYLSAAWQNPEYSQNSLLRVPASLREDLGFGETARSRLNLGSARRAAPTHFFRFAVLQQPSAVC